MNHPPHDLNEDLLTRWIDGQITPEEAALVEQQAAGMPELLREKAAAGRIGALLRLHFPSTLEPPSPEFFTSSVMEEILREMPAIPAKSSRAAGLPAWLSWLRIRWVAPVASAAAVAAAFMIWNFRAQPAGFGSPFAQTYSPDPRIIASAWYSEEAEATVIDLKNLDAVPDDHEIKAFPNVASADPPADGAPRVFYAANDSSRPLFVLSTDAREAPRVTEIH